MSNRMKQVAVVGADDAHHTSIELEVYAMSNQANEILICWAGNSADEGSSFFIDPVQALVLSKALLDAACLTCRDTYMRMILGE